MNIKKYINKLPFNDDLKKRIFITTQCKDCDHIRKVKNAGKVFKLKKYSYQLMHNGIKVLKDGYHGRGITEIVKLCTGHHEPQEEKVFFNILKKIKKNGLMIEFGAHWSYYSLWFNKEIDNSSNIMVEPDLNNMDIGKFNFKINDAKGEFINAFVSDVEIKTKFERESDNKILEIPSITLDGLIKRKKISHVDLLHVDVQGWELKMLQGSINSIKKNKIRFIFISTHHHTISHDPLIHQKCLKFIKKHGGYIVSEHSIYESYSGDGLIVASFDRKDCNFKVPISYNRSSNNMFNEIEYDLENLLIENKEKKLNKLDLLKKFIGIKRG
jgi:FkbM family methyltransferase